MSRGIQTHPVPHCPICGAQMTLRRPKQNAEWWPPFWGCNLYPDCKGTRNIREDGKPEED
jgi:ssDNA-binding Zn-finger/Zn-ribbon topoisomerase 1